VPCSIIVSSACCSMEEKPHVTHFAPVHPDFPAKSPGKTDDVDSTGAVCGQLAGACWGELGIPAACRERLARRDLIERALQGLGADQ
jgi:hypothetical protein